MSTEKMRLDRFLSEMTGRSRSDLKTLIKKGRVCVNQEVVRKPETKVDPRLNVITLEGETVRFEPFVYYMLNKPAGVVSATRDAHDQTVLDLMKDVRCRDLFPVGRLDKDTEGLLLMTNDGPLGHYLLSPKRHVPKVYYAEIDRPLGAGDVRRFEEGVEIEDGLTALPAKLEIIESSPQRCYVTIVEGKYHQVKRMFESVGKKVQYLKRLRMGPLCLDETLPAGAYRPLTAAETASITALMPEKKREET